MPILLHPSLNCGLTGCLVFRVHSSFARSQTLERPDVDISNRHIRAARIVAACSLAQSQTCNVTKATEHLERQGDGSANTQFACLACVRVRRIGRTKKSSHFTLLYTLYSSLFTLHSTFNFQPSPCKRGGG